MEKLTKQMCEMTISSMNDLRNACENGHLAIVDKILRQDTTITPDWITCARSASVGGYYATKNKGESHYHLAVVWRLLRDERVMNDNPMYDKLYEIYSKMKNPLK